MTFLYVFFALCSLVSITDIKSATSVGGVDISPVGDPRHRATAERSVKLRQDFKDALNYAGPKLGLANNEVQNMLQNIDTMVPREGLLNPWRKSNSFLSHIPGVFGGIDRDDFPSMLEMREGILIIMKAPRGENISLTAFYGNEITDQDTEQSTVKDSKDVARNSSWAYRFVFKSRIKAGYKDDVATVKPIFLLKYTDQIPVHLRVYNDSMVYVMGECKIKKLEIIARETGVFACDNLAAEELLVDAADQSIVTLKGNAESMDAVVDNDAVLDAEHLVAQDINMNLSRGSCKSVVVNPTNRLIVIGKLDEDCTGTFESANKNIVPKNGSVVWRNIKNMGNRLTKVTMVSTKAIVFGTGYLSWQIVKIPFKFLGAIGKRLSNAKVGVGGSVGVGPVRVGAGVLI